jgi:hypothetical protein
MAGFIVKALARNTAAAQHPRQFDVTALGPLPTPHDLARFLPFAKALFFFPKAH